jgi:DNA-binding transcriptional MerR regulator
MNHRDRAIQLKEQGLTIREVIAALAQEGFVNAEDKPYSYSYIQKVVAGINPQRGYRKPGVYDLSPKERARHNQAIAERQKERMRQWKRNNLERFRAYQAKYRMMCKGQLA